VCAGAQCQLSPVSRSRTRRSSGSIAAIGLRSLTRICSNRSLSYPHSLSWGTRRMVEKLTRDRARMRQTVALFTTMRTPVPESVRPGCRPATRPEVATLRAPWHARSSPASCPLQ
jgi:hypothetical protein